MKTNKQAELCRMHSDITNSNYLGLPSLVGISNEHTIICYVMFFGAKIYVSFNGYWWSSGSEQRKGVKWHSLEAMSMAKKDGDLDFRNLHGFSVILLGKHVGNLFKNPNLLVTKYSVKTGYQVWHEQHRTSSAAVPSGGWNRIWRLNIPNKMWIFHMAFLSK